MSGKAKDIAGQRFGRLIVTERAPSARAGTGVAAKWKCQCDCGAKIVTLGYMLRAGRSTSCGCWRRERTTIHGKSKMAEFHIWCGMRQRCRNQEHPSFEVYGGRGITVCDRWNLFENFLSDMGRRPSSKHTLDRFPNCNGNYEPNKVS